MATIQCWQVQFIYRPPVIRPSGDPPSLHHPPSRPQPQKYPLSSLTKPSGEILSLDWSSAIPACHPCPLSRVDWRDSISVPPSVLPTWSSLGKQFLFVEDKKGRGGTTGHSFVIKQTLHITVPRNSGKLVGTFLVENSNSSNSCSPSVSQSITLSFCTICG